MLKTNKLLHFSCVEVFTGRVEEMEEEEGVTGSAGGTGAYFYC